MRYGMPVLANPGAAMDAVRLSCMTHLSDTLLAPFKP